MTKYDKNEENENIEDEKIIYIIFKDEEPEDKLKDIEDIPKEIIKNKEIKYLKKSDIPKEEINKEENIYIVKDEEPEEIIYIETIEDKEKDKKYRKKPYIEDKDNPRK